MAMAAPLADPEVLESQIDPRRQSRHSILAPQDSTDSISDRMTRISYSPTPEDIANSQALGGHHIGRGMAKSIQNPRDESDSPYSAHRLRSISDVEVTMKPLAAAQASGRNLNLPSSSNSNNNNSPNINNHTSTSQVHIPLQDLEGVGLPQHKHHSAIAASRGSSRRGSEAYGVHEYDTASDVESHTVLDKAFGLRDVQKENPLYRVDAYENVLAYKRDPVRRDFVEATEADVQVFPGQAPRPEKFEFWDPHHQEFMFVPMPEDMRFHIIQGMA